MVSMQPAYILTIIYIHVFKNKVELKGVNEFINHFVAIPCGWWLNKI